MLECWLGYAQGEVKDFGCFCETNLHPDDEGRFRQAFGDYLAGRTDKYAIEFRVRTKDGGYKWIYSRGRAVERDHAHQPVRVIGAHTDITERKLADEALSRSEERFRGIIEDVHGISIQGYNEQREVIFWNRASQALYGYSPEEALGRKLEDLIIPAQMREEVVRFVARWLSEGTPIPHGELTLRHKNGSDVRVYSSHVMLETAAQAKEMFCIDVDLTQIKRTQDELIAAKQQAESANLAKSEFLANMSHEVRTPINGIMGMLQLLKTTDLKPEQEQYVQLAISSSERLTRLLADILDLSRVEAGMMTIIPQEFAIKALGDSLVELFTFISRTKSVDLKCSIDPSLPPTVVGDEARVRQILFNLVGNALKYTDQGTVHVVISLFSTAVSLHPGQFQVQFTVSDTGLGIPGDRLKDIFEPFRQVDNSYTRKYQGAGLGLTIVQRLVRLMEGTLSIDSEPAKGTSIRVVLPFMLPSGEKGAVDERFAGEPDHKNLGLRILLAEDEPSNQLPMAKLLQKAGHTVTLAENGRQVLDLLVDHDFDCILMDVQMPVMSGLEATKMIRRLENDAGMPEFRNSGIDQKNADIPASQHPSISESQHPSISASQHPRISESQHPRISESQHPRISESQHPRISESRHPRIPIIALTAYAMTGDREKFLEAGMDDYLAKPVRMEDLDIILQKIR
jgi:PAS domain S-box-containing protein